MQPLQISLIDTLSASLSLLFYATFLRLPLSLSLSLSISLSNLLPPTTSPLPSSIIPLNFTAFVLQSGKAAYSISCLGVSKVGGRDRDQFLTSRRIGTRGIVFNFFITSDLNRGPMLAFV
ncbi:hypothetical protein L2E82_10329 [Cichorium intybus]|uniref:Uncharacterized protein n=1 Tax=Cichorium intybus TaxID=13427 RepID=A0ACB9GAV5_CICIN|nr:hypothetical protein L2E82_10329 [Cichorium intybus]